MGPLPDWAKERPLASYELMTMGEDGAGTESVEVTRAEYIALKAHLSAMRGYRIGDVTNEQVCVAEIKKSIPIEIGGGDTQQQAEYLRIAREIYQHCPALVVLESDEFEGHLESLAEPTQR